MSNNQFNKLANNSLLVKTIKALNASGIEARLFETTDEVLATIPELIPAGAEVFTISSETLRLSGIADAINNSEKYVSVRKRLSEETEQKIKRKLGATPEYAIGSVQAITEDGHIWLASATGSQLAACVYGAEQVIYVVGAQKIVKNDEAALKRIYNYALPLENKRSQAKFGTNSRVGKLLIIHDDKPGRTKVLIVKQNLGY